MADPTTEKIVSFLEENRPLECTLCMATVAFKNKRTGCIVGVGVSRCGCLTRVISEAPSSPPSQDSGIGKEATTPKKGEDYVDMGYSKFDLETARREQELKDSMKERKLREEEIKLRYAKEQEALRKKEREEEALRRRKEEEEALRKQKQREEEEARRKQKIEEEQEARRRQKIEEEKEARRKQKVADEEEARRKQKIEEDMATLRRLKEEEARKKLLAEEAKKREELQQKQKEQAAKAESLQKAVAKMDLSRKTWTDMQYSPNLKAGAVVHIVFAWTPIDFQVVCDEDNDPLAVLQDDLLERVASGKLKKIKGTLQRDDVVVAEYEGAYYRARVSGASSTQCQLCFIDYGDKAIKKYEEIYEIPEDLFKAPIYGLKVRLEGLNPTDFSVGAMLSDTVQATLYETAYSLELMKKLDLKDIHICGILRDCSSGQTLNDVVMKTLLA